MTEQTEQFKAVLFSVIVSSRCFCFPGLQSLSDQYYQSILFLRKLLSIWKKNFCYQLTHLM